MYIIISLIVVIAIILYLRRPIKVPRFWATLPEYIANPNLPPHTNTVITYTGSLALDPSFDLTDQPKKGRFYITTHQWVTRANKSYLRRFRRSCTYSIHDGKIYIIINLVAAYLEPRFYLPVPTIGALIDMSSTPALSSQKEVLS